jgi:hypothetical protein
MDAIEQAIWNDVEVHECGCWSWWGASGCSIIRLLAELAGNPLPVGTRMYRMPECKMQSACCVNPDHVGTNEEWEARVREKRSR